MMLAFRPPPGPSVSRRRPVFQSNDVEWIQVYCITASVGDNDHTLREKNELGMRNRVFVSTGRDHSEWPEASFKPCTNALDVHE